MPDPDAEWIAEGWGGAEICDGKLWVAPVPFENCGQRSGKDDKVPITHGGLEQEPLPGGYAIQFTVNHQGSDNGLTLVFFAAEGLQGEDVCLSLDLPPRNGVYRNYNKGQLKNYTVSYWSRNKKPAW